MAAKKSGTRRYGAKAGEKVAKTMHERKHGTLRSGSGQKVTSKKQAIAIGLSEARKAGGKVPDKPAAKKSTAKKSTAKKPAAKKSTAKKSTAKRSTAKKPAAKKPAAKKSTKRSAKKTAPKRGATKKTAAKR
ncbi:MAG: hypothetical protein JNK04_09405 [Myxococcales bacterium]|nr:hypothetical protein [Myxococcales bacterium]